jgi:hypothetical protein
MTPHIASVTITFNDGQTITHTSPAVTPRSSSDLASDLRRAVGRADEGADRQRHRWTSDDELVTLDLYNRLGLAGADHPEVIAAAKLIGTTPASVNMRLGNQQAAATGGASGLTSVAKLTTRTWQEWSHRLDELPAAAAAARARLGEANSS